MFRILFAIINFSLILLVFNQMCGPKLPTNSQDCISTSNSIIACCFAKVSSVNKNSNVVLNSTNICLIIPHTKTFLTPFLTEMDLGISNDNIEINLDCGDDINSNRAFQQCGPKTPQSFDDCNQSSNSTSSCCYFQSPNGNATCLSNPGISNENITLFGVVIACNDIFLKYNYLKYLIFILGIFIIM